MRQMNKVDIELDWGAMSEAKAAEMARFSTERFGNNKAHHTKADRKKQKAAVKASRKRNRK